MMISIYIDVKLFIFSLINFLFGILVICIDEDSGQRLLLNFFFMRKVKIYFVYL